MTVRINTVKKYLRSVGELDTLLTEDDGYIDAYQFTHGRAISAGTLGDLVRSGFLRKVGKGRYRRTNKAITEFTITAMLEQREIDRGRMTPEESLCHKPKAANDAMLTGTGTQQPLGLVQPVEEPKAEPEYPNLVKHMHKQVERLERRVASLEQLLIRRGVA